MHSRIGDFMLAFVVLTAFAAGRDVANAASDLDPLAKHLGPEYIELEGRDADSWRSRPPKRDDVARRNGMMPPTHYEMMPPTGTG